MSDLTDWLRSDSLTAILAMVFGAGLLLTLASEAPIALVLLGALGFLAWAFARFGGSRESDEPEPASEHDPLTVLQERYARGDISEDEFERRLTTILETDELAGRDVTNRSSDRDLLTERT